MLHREGQFANAAGASIYFQYWQPEASAHAVLLIAHGAGEHSGRYQRFAEYFVRAGYAVAALDHPGHGRSDGERCHMRSLEDYLSTLRQFQQQVAADFPDVPLFLLGHSMGGLIAALYVTRHQKELAGCILSGPAIASELQPPWVQLLIIRLLSSIAPKLGVLQLDASGVSRDPAEVQRYLDDPLVHKGKLTARMVAELFRGMNRVQAEAGEIRLPLLLMHGGADSMTAPAGSRLLHERAQSEDNTLKIYEGLYHEIFNEPEREQVCADVLAWCEAHRTPQA